MAKGPHNEAQRVVLPNGMWLLLYENGNVKLAGYDRTLHVIEVLNREGGGQVFVHVKDQSSEPKTIAPRANDLVTVERNLIDAIRGIGQK